MLNVERLRGPFGVRINDLDLSETLAPEVIREIVDTFYANGFFVIPGQSLTPERFETFCSHFGKPHPHVIKQARMEGHPAILPLTNKIPDDREPAQGAAHWHTDQSYEADPVSATILYSLEAPEVGGETLVADMKGAYDDLSDETKKRIEGLQVNHLYGKGVAARKDDYEPYPLQSDEAAEVPMVQHLLARPHPVTGEKTLYSPAGTSRGIVGMSDEEGAALLNELAGHALRDKYTYKHKHAVGDVVAWDTSATMHAATPIGRATGPKDTRLLWRISVKGIPATHAPS